jgi:hypothetical protein
MGTYSCEEQSLKDHYTCHIIEETVDECKIMDTQLSANRGHKER